MRTLLFIYVVNAVIRILCAWGMFVAFINSHLFLAGFLLICAMKKNWLTYDYKYTQKIHFWIGK